MLHYFKFSSWGKKKAEQISKLQTLFKWRLGFYRAVCRQTCEPYFSTECIGYPSPKKRWHILSLLFFVILFRQHVPGIMKCSLPILFNANWEPAFAIKMQFKDSTWHTDLEENLLKAIQYHGTETRTNRSCCAVDPYVYLSICGGLGEDERQHRVRKSSAAVFHFLAEWLSSKELLWLNEKDNTSLWSPEKYLLLPRGISYLFVD